MSRQHFDPARPVTVYQRRIVPNPGGRTPFRAEDTPIVTGRIIEMTARTIRVLLPIDLLDTEAVVAFSFRNGREWIKSTMPSAINEPIFALANITQGE